MQPLQTCPVCQKPNPAGVEYCEDCGAALSVSPTTATTAAAPPSAENKSAPPGPTELGPAGSAPAGSPASGPPPEPATVDSTASPLAGSAPAASGVGATASAETRPRLVARRFGALTGDEIPLQGDRLVIGRFDPETGPVDIDLSATPESQHISRQHGELYREADGRWFVRDLGSTNGVFVKAGADATFGPRIGAPKALTDGDELAFGNARFTFRTE